MSFATTTDYAQIGDPAAAPGWFWVVTVHRVAAGDTNLPTSTYDFKGACPAAGTRLATGPAAWP